MCPRIGGRRERTSSPRTSPVAAAKARKQIRKIDKKTLKLCESYERPGNIRELQNIIERSVILWGGDTFWIDEAWLSNPGGPHLGPSVRLSETLEDREKRAGMRDAQRFLVSVVRPDRRTHTCSRQLAFDIPRGRRGTAARPVQRPISSSSS